VSAMRPTSIQRSPVIRPMTAGVASNSVSVLVVSVLMFTFLRVFFAFRGPFLCSVPVLMVRVAMAVLMLVARAVCMSVLVFVENDFEPAPKGPGDPA